MSPNLQPDNYAAFGISGSDTGVMMVGGDVTWTWLDNEGVHAQDLELTAYAQVSQQGASELVNIPVPSLGIYSIQPPLALPAYLRPLIQLHLLHTPFMTRSKMLQRVINVGCKYM